ncbi:hypothetical protein K488DRAFT_74869 [Vararia minispora EC-137]|uniref:Uncharacterized protein n=1 Tax=Vararia minispora EC-137 TaxID=1314806 RepID=A0ACB8Q5M9_9AGAM|nr:hypothetical protein K488DRAFT_74869 [Vararia minispora EC-137]
MSALATHRLLSLSGCEDTSAGWSLPRRPANTYGRSRGRRSRGLSMAGTASLASSQRCRRNTPARSGSPSLHNASLPEVPWLPDIEKSAGQEITELPTAASTGGDHPAPTYHRASVNELDTVCYEELLQEFFPSALPVNDTGAAGSLMDSSNEEDTGLKLDNAQTGLPQASNPSGALQAQPVPHFSPLAEEARKPRTSAYRAGVALAAHYLVALIAPAQESFKLGLYVVHLEDEDGVHTIIEEPHSAPQPRTIADVLDVLLAGRQGSRGREAIRCAIRCNYSLGVARDTPGLLLRLPHDLERIEAFKVVGPVNSRRRSNSFTGQSLAITPAFGKGRDAAIRRKYMPEGTAIFVVFFFPYVRVSEWYDEGRASMASPASVMMPPPGMPKMMGAKQPTKMTQLGRPGQQHGPVSLQTDRPGLRQTWAVPVAAALDFRTQVHWKKQGKNCLLAVSCQSTTYERTVYHNFDN